VAASLGVAAPLVGRRRHLDGDVRQHHRANTDGDGQPANRRGRNGARRGGN
jgi:hypothetical protein